MQSSNTSARDEAEVCFLQLYRKSVRYVMLTDSKRLELDRTQTKQIFDA